MAEHSVRMRLGFAYPDNEMVSVKCSNPFQIDPLFQSMGDVEPNAAFPFLRAAVVCLLGFVFCFYVWFCLVFFSWPTPLPKLCMQNSRYHPETLW